MRIILFLCISLLAACSLQPVLFEHTFSEPGAGPQMVSFNRSLTPVRMEDKYSTAYEIFVYSFCDSNGDGIGDLRGVLSKLDYIQELGFDAIWLTPVSPSNTYHKYDVKDYCAIDPQFGTIGDYDALVSECHRRGIRIYLDLVLNHTSSSHPWFLKAKEELRTISPGDAAALNRLHYAKYYQFSSHPGDGYVQLDNTGWYYEARFWSEMPDLSLSDADLRKEIDAIVSFWLERGTDGFRLDAVTSYHTGNHSENTEFMRWFTQLCRSKKQDCYLVGEAWTDRGTMAELYRSGIDSLFDFPFSGRDGIIASVLNQNRSAGDFVWEMIQTQDVFSASNMNFIDAPFYTNHDMDRSAEYYDWDNVRKMKMAYAMNLLMSGNAFLYYGEEIGMKGAGKDENRRAPMYWSANPNAAGLCAGPPYMDAVQMTMPPLDEQTKDSYSMVRWIREVLRVRNAFPVIARGKTAEAAGISDDAIAAFIRYRDGLDPVLIVMNLRGEGRYVDLSPLREELTLAAVLNTDAQLVEKQNATLYLPAYSAAVLTEAR